MPETTLSIDTLLEQMVAHNASDLHITVGSHPALRVRGHLERLEGSRCSAPMTPASCCTASSRASSRSGSRLDRQLDLSYSIPGLARFRVNIYSQRGASPVRFASFPPI